MDIIIKYINNVLKEEIFHGECHEEDISGFVKQQIIDAGYQFEEKNLYLEDSFDTITYVYSEVVSPQNAFEFAEIDGIKICIRTAEKNHMNEPHVHAFYNGKEMRISLIDLSAKGSLGNRKKEKVLLQFIDNNREKLKDSYGSVIKTGVIKKENDYTRT